MPSILQFGTGRFLRGFWAPLADRPHSISVVQSRISGNGARYINAVRDGYHVWVRGISDGRPVERTEVIRSFDRAMIAGSEWDQVLDLAADPDLKLVVSNTTERGLSLEPDCEVAGDSDSGVPPNYPGRLLAILRRRYERGCPGVIVLPLELVEYNAQRLLDLVTTLAGPDDVDFLDWLTGENHWLSNLVDRIVVDVTGQPPWPGDDPLAVMTEPYSLLAIEGSRPTGWPLPDHETVQWTDDLRPLFLRKVRILNALHTAMVAHSLPRGFATVLDVMNDSAERAWLEHLLQEEIMPALDSHGVDHRAFAAQVLERFENPFFQHRLRDIAQGHATKLQTRIAPTIEDYRNRFRSEPPRLLEIMSAPLH